MKFIKKVIRKLIRIAVSLLKLVTDPFVVLIQYWPGDWGYRLRYCYYRKKLKHLGEDVQIDVGVLFRNPQFISIGNHCWIDRDAIIMAGEDKQVREKRFVQKFESNVVKKGEVIIGDNVHIGVRNIISGISAGVFIGHNCGFASDSKIYAMSHHYRSIKNPGDSSFCYGAMIPLEKQCLVEGAVVLEENIGIATNVFILPGTLICKNSFIKINSVVSGIFEENSIVEGNPAKKVNDRFVAPN